MKLFTTIIFFVLIFNCFGFNWRNFLFKQSLQKDETIVVGTIQSSLLSVTQYQNLYGTCWVKMTGQNISGSDLSTISGISALPNTAGMFFRNSGGNAAALGSTQLDAIKSHQHSGVNGDSTAYYASGAAGGTHPSANGTNGTIQSTDLFGGIETRPVNLALNFFIKINNSCN